MLTTLRVLSLGAVGALVLIAVALYPVLGSGTDDYPGAATSSPLVPVLGVLAVGVVAHLLTEAVGYRTPALDPASTPQARLARTSGAVTTTGILRMTLCEGVGVLALAAAFLVESDGFVVYVAGAVVSAALLGLHVYPWSRPVGKVRSSLERDGVTVPTEAGLGRPTHG